MTGSGLHLKLHLAAPLVSMLLLALALYFAGVYKPGGPATLSREHMLECIEAAKQRSQEVRGLLQQALDAAGAQRSG